jgi:hypothetical protein
MNLVKSGDDPDRCPGLGETLTEFTFASGDQKLDELFETARAKFLDPNPEIRRESVEKLWDAFERLKTLEPGQEEGERQRSH